MKNMNAALWAIGAIVAAGAAYGYVRWSDQAEFDLRSAPLVRALKDPDTVKFRDWQIRGAHLCGEVNSRGSAGGYVGFKRFVSHPGGYAIEGETVDPFNGGKPAETADLIADLQLQTAFMEAHDHRKPTGEELLAARFDAIWKANCS